MIDILIDAIIDTIKLIPFLFIAYLIMEYLEHKTLKKNEEKIRKSGKAGPVIGGLLGIIPQCGFSVSATNLYIGRVISLGTLIAIYLSTSDEMLPILISESAPLSVIIQILVTKLIIGIAVGLVIDLLINKNNDYEIKEICEHEHCHCEQGIVKSSIKHTINISFFIFIITLVLNMGISFIGEENIANFMMNRSYLGPIFASIVGLIPNCAASVIITELYVSHMITAGSLIAGLLTNAGIGLLVLFKNNHNIKENLKIVLILYSTGVICGSILQLLNITF